MKHFFTNLFRYLTMKNIFFKSRKLTIHSDIEFEKVIKEKVETIKLDIMDKLRQFRLALPERKDIDVLLDYIQRHFDRLRQDTRIRYQSDQRRAAVNRNISRNRQISGQLSQDLIELKKDLKFIELDIESSRLDYSWKEYYVWLLILLFMYLSESYLTYTALLKVMRDSPLFSFIAGLGLALAFGIVNFHIATRVNFKVNGRSKFFLIGIVYFIIFYCLALLRASYLGIQNPYFSIEVLVFVVMSFMLTYGAILVTILKLPSEKDKKDKLHYDMLKNKKDEIEAKIETINTQLTVDPHRENVQMLEEGMQIIFEKSILEYLDSECELLKSEVLVNVRIIHNIHSDHSIKLLN